MEYFNTSDQICHFCKSSKIKFNSLVEEFTRNASLTARMELVGFVRSTLECLGEQQRRCVELEHFKFAGQILSVRKDFIQTVKVAHAPTMEVIQKLFSDLLLLEPIVKGESSGEEDPLVVQYPVRLAVHLLLNKSPEEKGIVNSYRGGLPQLSAECLLKAISKMDRENLSAMGLDESVIEALGAGLDHFVDFLNSLSDKTEEELFEAAMKFSERVVKGEIGEKWLIPANTLRHAMCFEIASTAVNRFRLTVFNSGDGVEFHPNDCFRNPLTFLEYENIPGEAIVQFGFWRDLFLRTSDALNFSGTSSNQVDQRNQREIEEFYREINRMGSAGDLVFAESEEESESLQEWGTCSTQTLMSWIRRSIMRATKGSPIEGEACYKAFKSELYKTHVTLNAEKLDSIHSHLSASIQKHLSALSLLHYARDRRQFLPAECAMRTFLSNNQVDLSYYSSHFASEAVSDTPLSRYARLLALSKIIAAEVKVPLPSESCFDHARARSIKKRDRG